MARKTNEHLHNELQLLKLDMDHMKAGQNKLQGDLSMIKRRLLNPDDGAISKVNRNTEFRKSGQKALWSIWTALIGIIAKLIFWN